MMNEWVTFTSGLGFRSVASNQCEAPIVAGLIGWFRLMNTFM